VSLDTGIVASGVLNTFDVAGRDDALVQLAEQDATTWCRIVWVRVWVSGVDGIDGSRPPFAELPLLSARRANMVVVIVMERD
jgi:hypothetical protein